MTMKITNDEGEEIEVFTAAEVQAREATVRTTVEGEYKPKLDEATTKLTEAEKRAAERAGEFGEFRKLRDEDVAKLAEKDRIIYENTLRLKEADDKRIESEQKTLKASVDAAIKAKAGDNPKLIEKINEVWGVVNIDATTPEQITAKLDMVLGAISTTAPDLLSTVNGFSGGAFQPPTPPKKDGESFADSEQGKAAAAEIGLTLEAPKT